MLHARRAWPSLIMLSLFMLINFWDRAAFGFAGPSIMRDLRLSHAQFGLLGGIFFALFSVASLGIGRLSDRFSPRWIVASMALLWALAQLLMASASRLPLAITSRLLLGAGEGPALPSALHLAYGSVPERRHALVTAVINVGPPIGIASGAIAITWAIGALGWREAFVVLGVISAAWSLAWIVSQRPAERETASERQSLWRSIRFNSTTVGIIVAAFGVYWLLALAVNWFPTLLQSAAGATPMQSGQVLGVAWAIQALALPAIGFASESLRRKGLSSELALALPGACGVAIAGLALIGYGAGAAISAAAVLIVICLVGTAAAITCLPPLAAAVTPLRDRGTALGVFVALSSTGGIFAPLVFGHVVDRAGGGANGYRMALLTSGLLLIVAAAISLALMRPTLHRCTDG
jgi:MFS family permease